MTVHLHLQYNMGVEKIKTNKKVENKIIYVSYHYPPKMLMHITRNTHFSWVIMYVHICNMFC